MHRADGRDHRRKPQRGLRWWGGAPGGARDARARAPDRRPHARGLGRRPRPGRRSRISARDAVGAEDARRGRASRLHDAEGAPAGSATRARDRLSVHDRRAHLVERRAHLHLRVGPPHRVGHAFLALHRERGLRRPHQPPNVVGARSPGVVRASAGVAENLSYDSAATRPTTTFLDCRLPAPRWPRAGSNAHTRRLGTPAVGLDRWGGWARPTPARRLSDGDAARPLAGSGAAPRRPAPADLGSPAAPAALTLPSEGPAGPPTTLVPDPSSGPGSRTPIIRGLPGSSRSPAGGGTTEEQLVRGSRPHAAADPPGDCVNRRDAPWQKQRPSSR